MKALNDLNIFVDTAKQGSFSKSANLLDITPAAVSAAIKRLETQIGFPLFVRSTRSLRLTDEGAIFLDKASRAIALIQDGIDQIAEGRGELAGKLYLSAPSDFGRNLLLDWVDEFTMEHPRVSVKMELSDSFVDMYARPVDIAIRYGEPTESNLIAIPLCSGNFRVVCASPDYLIKNPVLDSPADLQTQNCLCYMLSDLHYNKWTLTKGDVTESVTVMGNPSANDGDIIRRLALKGRGIAYKSLMDVSQDIIEKRLVPLFPEWTGDAAPLYMVCPDRRLFSPAVRKFQEFLRKRCNEQHKKTVAVLNSEYGKNLN
ncbi:HTH-type transcriptional regulator DmlR [invertebrate metagenome]|uniref:HTH-type transcriptional regulator DmlR n=1 Tax=invertebrate metagenome TaxID=1711999 RepID=A0A2H9T7M1_9ZZZZ